MASEPIPINAKLATWARERSGITPDDAGKKFAQIAEWESGKGLPTYPQLERMADEFKVPIAVFFFPDVPATPPIRESFRTLPDTKFASIPRSVRLLLRKAKAFQLNLLELAPQGRNPAGRIITRDLRFLLNNSDLNTMARRVREWLGITIEQQMAWPDDEAALKAWRDALQRSGVFVFKDAFKTDNFSGFSLYDDEFPVVFVNNTNAKTRQIFTLFRELAHLLFHTSGIDTDRDDYIARLPASQARIEIICNSFASRLLIPDQAFNDAIGIPPYSEATAERLAAQFHVSREAIFRKFLDRDWITQETYTDAAVRWKQQKNPSKPGGDHYWTKIAYLGRDYITLALRQFHQNQIDDRQLAEYLDTKPKNISTLEEYFARAAQ